MPTDTPADENEAAVERVADLEPGEDLERIQGESDTRLDLDATSAPPPDPELDSLVVEFVARLNARDMDGLSPLLAAEVEAPFLGELSREGVITGLADLMFERPDMVVTRGDLGNFPLAATWLLDEEADHYQSAGYFLLELSETEETRVGRIDHVSELEDDELVVERPAGTTEWEDWSAHDSS